MNSAKEAACLNARAAAATKSIIADKAATTNKPMRLSCLACWGRLPSSFVSACSLGVGEWKPTNTRFISIIQYKVGE